MGIPYNPYNPNLNPNPNRCGDMRRGCPCHKDFKSGNAHAHHCNTGSLRSRRLEVVGARKNGRTRRRHARGEGAPRVSPSRAPVISCAHYFQAPATQAITPVAREGTSRKDPGNGLMMVKLKMLKVGERAS